MSTQHRTKQPARTEKVGVKRAKAAISAAAISMTLGGWFLFHSAEKPPAAQAYQPVASIAASAPAQGQAGPLAPPAPITLTRSSR